jgi:hypothetical protein
MSIFIQWRVRESVTRSSSCSSPTTVQSRRSRTAWRTSSTIDQAVVEIENALNQCVKKTEYMLDWYGKWNPHIQILFWFKQKTISILVNSVEQYRQDDEFYGLACFEEFRTLHECMQFALKIYTMISSQASCNPRRTSGSAAEWAQRCPTLVRVGVPLLINIVECVIILGHKSPASFKKTSSILVSVGSNDPRSCQQLE